MSYSVFHLLYQFATCSFFTSYLFSNYYQISMANWRPGEFELCHSPPPSTRILEEDQSVHSFPSPFIPISSELRWRLEGIERPFFHLQLALVRAIERPFFHLQLALVVVFFNRWWSRRWKRGLTFAAIGAASELDGRQLSTRAFTSLIHASEVFSSLSPPSFSLAAPF